jgi:hypothetical protein
MILYEKKSVATNINHQSKQNINLIRTYIAMLDMQRKPFFSIRQFKNDSQSQWLIFCLDISALNTFFHISIVNNSTSSLGFGNTYAWDVEDNGYFILVSVDTH